MIETQYTVSTPCGSFTAQWDEDDSIPVSYQGDPDAIGYFQSYLAMNAVTGQGGALLHFDHLEPADLYGFCQSESCGIVVLPGFDELMALQAEQAADDSAALMDAICTELPDQAEGLRALFDAIDPLQRIKLTGQLGAAMKALTEAAGPLAKVKAAAQVAALVKELAGDESPVQETDGELSDDPNSPNYRYKDTGYIADSRKEKAAGMIAEARKTGQRLRASDIDFDAVEQNPRQAAELITKSNLFGKTDWTALQEKGMDPGAGFLIDKIYGAIGPGPATDGALSRHDYALGLETIRDRLEDKLTVDDVMEVLKEIRDELNGSMLNADESEQYELLGEQIGADTDELNRLEKSSDPVYSQAQEARSAVYVIEREIENRQRRKWAVDPAKLAQLAEAKQRSDALWEEFRAIRDDVNPKADELRKKIRAAMDERSAVTRLARTRNLLENQVTRSWLTFGERFFKLINYRSFKGSDAFAGHVTNARSGRIKDWGWADKDRPTKPRDATKQEINFQLKVADSFERKGGQPVAVNGTKALEQLLGLSAVQSGNWVLKDPNSAKFHVEHTAAAFADLSDVLGIDVGALGLGGRLGMAFGARGTGGKNAARAHFEPVHRVINLTKMGGGGALGHEYFHAIDNMLHELVNQQASGKKDDFVTLSPNLLPDGPIKDAVIGLRAAMLDGDHRVKEPFSYAPGDIALAKRNIDGRSIGISQQIKAAGDAAAAVRAVDAYFSTQRQTPKLKKNWQAWRHFSVAYYHDDANPAGEDGQYQVDLPTGPAMSSFAKEAVRLDSGDLSKYWSSREEMAARAFQSYIEDKLAAQDRRNDYLSVYADNKYHFDPLFGIQWNPFPEGEERERINAAFDVLFEAIRNEKVFEKAAGNPALLDAIFGEICDE